MLATYKQNELLSFNYSCSNPECKNYHINDEQWILVIKKYKDEFKDEECSECKSIMYNKGITGAEQLEIHFGFIRGMSKQAKRKVLQDRSTAHYHREIKDKKIEMHRNFTRKGIMP